MNNIDGILDDKEYNSRQRLMGQEEEQKAPNISKTRIGDIDRSSILNEEDPASGAPAGKDGLGDLIELEK